MKGAVYGFVNKLTDNEEVACIRDFAERNGLGDLILMETSGKSFQDWRSRAIVRTAFEAKENDHLIVTSFGRIGLDAIHLYDVLSFCDDNGISFHVVSDGFCTASSDSKSRLMLQTFKTAAEMDKEELKRRNGLENISPKKGRPLSSDTIKLDNHREEILELRRKGTSLSWIANYFGVSQSTMKNWASRPFNKS